MSKSRDIKAHTNLCRLNIFIVLRKSQDLPSANQRENASLPVKGRKTTLQNWAVDEESVFWPQFALMSETVEELGGKKMLCEGYSPILYNLFQFHRDFKTSPRTSPHCVQCVPPCNWKLK